MSRTIFFYTILFLSVCSCKPVKQSAQSPIQQSQTTMPTGEDKLVKAQEADKQSIMKQKPEYGLLGNLLEVETGPFAQVFQDPEAYNLQIIYTQIDRDKNGRPHFTEHRFRTQTDAYFYPASTVKMPTAILALQKLREQNLNGLGANTTMITETDFSGQTPVFNDPSTTDGRPTIAQYIKKIFLVSDNDAFNRLYEFLGPGYINSNLRRMGYTEAEIIHRLDISLTEEENRHTNPIRFLNAEGRELYAQPGKYNGDPYAKRKESIGKGYMKSGNLVNSPMDFSRKNKIALTSLHEIMKAVIFPEAMPVKQRFFLEQDDYFFLRKYMSAAPAAVGNPPYDKDTYYDTYCKFLLFGADKNQQIPIGLKMFNKVGDAYGHLIDVAYVADAANGVEFMLSVVVYCNKDGVLNDDTYDYEELGFPLMKYIGQRIYFYERSRKKENSPNLDWIRALD